MGTGSAQRRVIPRALRSDAAVVLISAAIVLVASGARLRGLPSASASRGSTPPAPALPSPLPSGAVVSEPREGDLASGCSFTDRGFGAYEGWRPLPLGRLLVPNAAVLAEDGSFDLLLHFHGAEPVRKEIAPQGLGLVVYALDAGVGSSQYEKPFAFDEAFPSLLHAIEHQVSLATGREGAHAGRVIVSSWSAGSGAVAQIVGRHRELVSAVLLLDSLYDGYAVGQRAPDRGQLAPFTDLARLALDGKAPFFLSYSAIRTEGYASTSEVAAFILSELGRQATPVVPDSAAPLGLRAAFEEGRLVVRGYGGETKEAHCEHLRYLVPALRETVLPALAR